MTPEGRLQTKIIKYLENCTCVKLIKVNLNWMPDLLILPWNWKCYFIEVKTESWRLSELQKYRIKKLKEDWYEVLVPYWWEDFLKQFMTLTI